MLGGIAEDEERILTQRTDQIDRFVRRLTASGVSPLVLRGGLGKEARAAVRETLSQDSEDGVVLVATAS